MPPNSSNPAARLADILKKIAATNNGVSTKNALVPILGTTTDPEFARSVGYLVELPDKVVASVTAAASADDDIEWYLQWKTPVDRALEQVWNFGSAISGVQQQFGADHVMNLEACSQLLSKARTEPRIEPTTLEDLKRKTQELHDALENAVDLPADLKLLMLDQLDRISRALREFVIRGPEGLTEALDGAVGALVRAARTGLTQPADPPTRKWVDKFFKHLNALAAVITIIGGTLQIQAGVDSLFLESPPAAVQIDPNAPQIDPGVAPAETNVSTTGDDTLINDDDAPPSPQQ